MSSIMFRLRLLAQRLEQLLPNLFGFPGGQLPPPGILALAGVGESHTKSCTRDPFNLKDLIGDGLLWAVPKHRRTVEKRLKRKYGSPDYKLKIFVPKTHLRICSTCGGDHEVGVLCPTCYAKVQTETKLMQNKIQSELGLEPVDKEVIVLYDREKEEQPAEFWEGKRIVEMEKTRPPWFSKNLLQRSTQSEADTKEVKPETEKLG
ncbi:39S ribosomal protein L32, mitochondrial [Uranotaenia lowii]|uniref:39S ribosomal protein L32, mitochondrial n=1 Tax=Uranotaenia lowii TaxID=190385 RepID=UPI00247B0597|nr:39S ribosomal protein L32, mitochondrial [Uranotaenia lowii]